MLGPLALASPVARVTLSLVDRNCVDSELSSVGFEHKRAITSSSIKSSSGPAMRPLPLLRLLVLAAAAVTCCRAWEQPAVEHHQHLVHLRLGDGTPCPPPGCCIPLQSRCGNLLPVFATLVAPETKWAAAPLLASQRWGPRPRTVYLRSTRQIWMRRRSSTR